MRTDDERPSRRTQRVPWYRNSNWLLLAVVIVVGIWLFRVFSQNSVADKPKTAASLAVAPRATATAARVYQKPVTPAALVQHAHTTAEQGIANATDLTGTLARAPKTGDMVIAFASTGFGCIAAPGWTALGSGSGSAAVAYRIAQPGDAKVLVPFTTSRTTTYTLELIEVAGGPDILGSTQSGGAYVQDSVVPSTISLAIPQTGGLLLRLYAASGMASGNGAPLASTGTSPAGQTQTLLDRVPASGWGAELIVRASTTDPHGALQPFTATESTTFAGHKGHGNTVAGWLVWIGGPLGVRT